MSNFADPQNLDFSNSIKVPIEVTATVEGDKLHIRARDQIEAFAVDDFHVASFGKFGVPRAIEQAFSLLPEASTNPLVSGLIAYRHKISQKFEGLSNSAWGLEGTISKQIEGLAETGKLRSCYKTLLGAIESEAPEALAIFKETNLMPWVGSGFSARRYPVRIVYVKHGTEEAKELEGFYAGWSRLRGSVQTMGTPIELPQVLSSLALTGAFPKEVAALTHEAIHVDQFKPLTEMKILHAAGIATLLFPLAGTAAILSPHVNFWTAEGIAVAALLLGRGILKFLNKRRNELYNDIFTSGTLLAEAQAYEGCLLDFNEVVHHITPSIEHAFRMSIRYGPDAKSMAIPMQVEVKVSSEIPLPEDHDFHMKLMGMAMSTACGAVVQKVSFNAYNTVRALRLLRNAESAVFGSSASAYDAAWLRKHAAKADLDLDYNYPILKEALTNERRRLGLSDDAEWGKVAPALYAWGFLESIVLQDRVRGITCRELNLASGVSK